MQPGFWVFSTSSAPFYQSWGWLHPWLHEYIYKDHNLDQDFFWRELTLPRVLRVKELNSKKVRGFDNKAGKSLIWDEPMAWCIFKNHVGPSLIVQHVFGLMQTSCRGMLPCQCYSLTPSHPKSSLTLSALGSVNSRQKKSWSRLRSLYMYSCSQGCSQPQLW